MKKSIEESEKQESVLKNKKLIGRTLRPNSLESTYEGVIEGKNSTG